MKSVVVNFIGRKGGGAVYAYEMTRGLIESGCKVYAIVSEGIENLSQWEKLSLAELIKVPSYSTVPELLRKTISFWFFGRAKIKKKFRNIQIDAVYLPMIQPWCVLVNRLFKDSKLIVTLHDPKPHIGASRILNYLKEHVAKAADDIIILSSEFKEYTCAVYKKESSRVHVIPHGVFDYYSKNTSSYSVTSDAEYNFLFFGRITKYKGLPILAEAYNRLFMEEKNISLYIVGSGDFAEYADIFPRQNNITIVNRYIADEEVSAYFRGKNVITVLPYIEATQSGVIPIAMKERSLLIVTNTGALKEQTGNGKFALLSEPNADSLFEVMKYAVNHFEECKTIIDRAQQHVESLTWDKLSAQVADIIT